MNRPAEPFIQPMPGEAPGRWRYATLWVDGVDVAAAAPCERLRAALQAVEASSGLAVVAAGVSALSPGAHIRPHTGPTNRRWDLHLGLVVPEGEDIHMWVGERAAPRRWREGHVLLFDGDPSHRP